MSRHSIKLSNKGLAGLTDSISPREMGRLINAIKAAVARSARVYQMREHMTSDEAKRRVEFCVQLAKELHMDKGWTVQKIIDHMWQALDHKLSSKVWVPNDSSFYPVPT